MKRDVFGSLVGLCVFLAGIGLMLLTFRSCYEMFSAPVDQALGLKQGKTLDYNQAGTNLLGIVLKSCLLVLMAIVASMISSRGIHLYSRSLFTTAEAKKSDQ